MVLFGFFVGTAFVTLGYINDLKMINGFLTTLNDKRFFRIIETVSLGIAKFTGNSCFLKVKSWQISVVLNILVLEDSVCSSNM